MATKLLIEPLLNGKAHGTPIQAKKFSLDFRVTNSGNEPSVEFDITSIKLKSSEGQDLVDDFGLKTFFVGIINPGESTVIRIGDTGQPLCGLVDITVLVKPRAENSEITFLQKNPFTLELSELQAKNRWVDFFYIKSTSADLQERTNVLVIILSVIAALLAVIQAIPVIERFLSLSC